MICKTAALAVIALLALTPGAVLHAQTPPTAASARGPSDTISTGYWKYQTSLLFLGDTEFRCVGPEDVAKFFDGPCKKHTQCIYPIKEVANGKAKYDGYWIDRHGKRTNVKAEGTYASRRFDLSARIAGIPVSGKITATWQAATCPAGAPH